MRLIDADDFIEYLGLDAENAREDNIGEIVTHQDSALSQKGWNVCVSPSEERNLHSQWEVKTSNELRI